MTDAPEKFFATWALQDDAARLAQLTACFATSGSYADPRTDAPLIGPDAVAAYVAMFAKSAPGAIAEVAKAETRAGVTRATIAFKMPNGMEQSGQYFIEEDDSGQITRMVGFVGTGAPE